MELWFLVGLGFCILCLVGVVIYQYTEIKDYREGVTRYKYCLKNHIDINDGCIKAMDEKLANMDPLTDEYDDLRRKRDNLAERNKELQGLFNTYITLALMYFR